MDIKFISGQFLNAGVSSHLSTRQFSSAVKKAAQTIRKNYCENGHCYGIRPIKIGNALLWPAAEVAALLASAVKPKSKKSEVL